MASEHETNTLPDEMLRLICLELGAERDFSTLYSCSLAAKALADPALRTMYQFHEQAPAFASDEAEMTKMNRPEKLAVKAADPEAPLRPWANLWRSIILSSQDKAFKPYCRYIRRLDFRNLSQLLEDYKFSKQLRKDFFANALHKFEYNMPKQNTPTRMYKYLDVIAIINAIGEAITPKSLLLEELDGHLSPGFLPRWIRNTPRLQSMTLWDGNALTTEAGLAIRERTPEFKNLTIRGWTDPDADQTFADFLKNLDRDTLEYFEMISINRLGGISFDALGSQSGSLKELKLNNLSREAVENLNKLKSCTSLRLLALEDNTPGATQLESNHNNVFVEVVSWLRACRDLRDISLKNFFDGPAILAQVLASPSITLEKLSLEGYKIENSASFHSSLSEQRQLQSVWLKGNGEDASPNELTIMVDALCQLQGLRELYLKDISDEFEEIHITSLAVHLPLLEDFWTSGQELSADILPVLASMKHLKNLNLYAITQFSATEILDFISLLDGTTQRGFNLMVMAADSEYDLTDEEQDLIREVMRTELDGRFDFVLWREADPSDSEDD